MDPIERLVGIISCVVMLLMLLGPIAHYWFTRIYLPTRKRKQEARKLARQILERTRSEEQ